MAINLGKKFESVFREDWEKSFPNGFLYRLPDQMSGFAGSCASNPCDFIGFADHKLFLIECKTHRGASIPFSAIRQKDALISFIGRDSVYPGVLLWLSEKDLVLWIPAETLRDMIKDGMKSVGVKTMSIPKYIIYKIPSKKKRVFLTSDYQYLVNSINENNNNF